METSVMKSKLAEISGGMKALTTECEEMSNSIKSVSSIVLEMFDEVKHSIFGKNATMDEIRRLTAQSNELDEERDVRDKRHKNLSAQLIRVMDRMYEMIQDTENPAPEFSPIHDAILDLFDELSEMEQNKDEKFAEAAGHLIANVQKIIAEAKAQSEKNGTLTSEKVKLFFEAENIILETEAVIVKPPRPLSDELAVSMSHVLDLPKQFGQLLEKGEQLRCQYFGIANEIGDLLKQYMSLAVVQINFQDMKSVKSYLTGGPEEVMAQMNDHLAKIHELTGSFSAMRETLVTFTSETSKLVADFRYCRPS